MASVRALEVRDLVARGERAQAAALLTDPIADLVERQVVAVRITSDEYSLNSVSGVADLADGSDRFFKFHVEDGEADHIGEYYRANVLADAGLPVDVPLAASTVAGEQLVLYSTRTDRRMVDVCLDLERADGDEARLSPELDQARHTLDRAIGEVIVRSLRESDDNAGEQAALHQLFSHRLHEPDGTFPGGRYLRWYIARPQWAELSHRHWVINGVAYAETLSDLVGRAVADIDPVVMGRGPVVTAHGDDHNGNVWVESSGESTRLSLFDPAFAGDDLPALLALVKPTFHNVFAHPLWLYHPGDVDDERLVVVDDGTVVHIATPPLAPLRHQQLDSLVTEAWIPLLVALRDRGLLDPSWRRIVRSALMMCPLLVTDLLSDARTPDVQLLGLGMTVMMGSEPTQWTDPLADALDAMQEAVSG